MVMSNQPGQTPQPSVSPSPVPPTATPTPTLAPTNTPNPTDTATPTSTPTPVPSSSTDLVLYEHGVASGIIDYSFGFSFRNSCDQTRFISPPCSYAITYTPYGGINLHIASGNMSTFSFKALEWDVFTNGQSIRDFSALLLDTRGRVIRRVTLSPANITGTPASGWVHVAVPLSQLNPSNVLVKSIQLKNRTNRNLAMVYIDDIRFTSKAN